MSIRARRTRRAWPTSAASPISRAAPAASPSPPAWPATATILDLLDSGAHVLAHGRSLWRHLPAVRARAQALGRPRLQLRRSSAISPKVEAAIRPETRHDLGRNADQSAAEAGRSRRRSPRWRSGTASSPSPTTPSPAPGCSGRWSIGFDMVDALGHQISQRPFRHHRRHRRGRRQRRSCASS